LLVVQGKVHLAYNGKHRGAAEAGDYGSGGRRRVPTSPRLTRGERPSTEASKGSDAKAVHGDLGAWLAAGVLSRNESGRVGFPYDAVKVEFLLRAA
ncbi:MAG: hypothetical protein KGL43_00770, partial [Burkholderiales bacterium]|nr:hypothetical protein [Burkholderiales bacterium]